MSYQTPPLSIEGWKSPRHQINSKLEIMATITLKVIKKKDFEVSKVKHVHYTAAYKGRVFGVSTLRFEDGEIVEDTKTNTITIPKEVEVIKEVNTDPLTGEVTTYLTVVPKLDLVLAAF